MNSGRALWKWLIVTGCCLVVVCVGAALSLYALRPRLHEIARQRVASSLQSHFKSSVEFSDFHLVFFPRIQVIIEGIVMRHQGRTDIPPLIEVRKAVVDASPAAFWGRKHEISRVHLEGLQVHTPPKTPGGPPMIQGTDADLASKFPVTIDEVDTDNALIVLLRKPADEGKPPNQFLIRSLVMHHFSFDRPADFHALLTNPKPRGEIHCDGQFGPWNAEEPSETPVSANYTFRDADLSTLNGIKGILSSEGTFAGPLNYLHVEGKTDTPDFALRTSNHPMALHTDFSAIVDGTNGDTVLTNVTARFLHTVLETHGAVVDVYPKVKGRTIVLDASTSHARVEDLLALAVKSDRPVMTGSAELKTKILIPERNEDVMDRLQLDGQFQLADVHFTSSTTRDKVDSLSRKGQGKPKDDDIEDSVSNFQGQFTLGDADAKFSKLEFSVEGAAVTLGGNYNLDSGQLDFRGHLQLDAKLSQTMTGWKSVVMKPFDHFFKGQDGGTEVPIKITGTRDHPTFGTDFHDKDSPKHALNSSSSLAPHE